MLDNEALVQLEVFSLDGKRVALLKNERQQVGEYTVEFDGSDLPTGVYFARLTTGGKQMETVKFFKQ